MQREPVEVARWADWPVSECVPSDTMISSPNGPIPAEQVSPGTVVFDARGRDVLPTMVTATTQTKAGSLYEIGSLLATADHPVWTSEHGYIQARHLTSDMHLGLLDMARQGDRNPPSLTTSPRPAARQLTLDCPVPVCNFQTLTGNYFANNVLVHNCDLHARHYWLLQRKADLQARLEGAPDFYDVKIAGRWVWGMCLWVGGGWCTANGPWVVENGELVRHSRRDTNHQAPHTDSVRRGVRCRIPHMAGRGQGINHHLPPLEGEITAPLGACESRTPHLLSYFTRIADQLRNVRICCGDWSRVCTPVVTTGIGLTGIFMDPPYSAETGRDRAIYTSEDLAVAHTVREWCIANGDNPLLRIALCGYEGEHVMPDTWECMAWRTDENSRKLTRNSSRSINPDREGYGSARTACARNQTHNPNCPGFDAAMHCVQEF